jgi:hypothetical protein
MIALTITFIVAGQPYELVGDRYAKGGECREVRQALQPLLDRSDIRGAKATCKPETR